MPKVLVLGRPLDWILARLRDRYEVVEGSPSASDASDADAAVCFGGGQVDRAALDALPALQVVVNFGAGYDRIDVGAARERGIAVAYLPGLTSTCVADHAMALLLAARRGIVAGHAFIGEGRWLQQRFPLMQRASGQKLGIYGLGGIGHALARRAEGFDMPVAYHNRSLRRDVGYRYFGSLLDLAAWADILAVCCPATPATVGSVNAEVLTALGPGGLLVNVARGSIVDENALVDALDHGCIAGAALDVFPIEPCRPDRLLGRDNVVLTPHVGGGTDQTWQDTADRMIGNLDSYFAHGHVLDPVPGP